MSNQELNDYYDAMDKEIPLNPDEFDDISVKVPEKPDIIIRLSIFNKPDKVSGKVFKHDGEEWFRWTFHYIDPLMHIPKRDEDPDKSVAVGVNKKNGRIEYCEINLGKFVNNVSGGIENIKTVLCALKTGAEKRPDGGKMEPNSLFIEVAKRVFDTKSTQLIRMAQPVA